MEEFITGDKYEVRKDDLTREASDENITADAKQLGANDQRGAESVNKNEPSKHVASSTDPARADNGAASHTKPTNTLPAPAPEPSCFPRLPCFGMRSMKLSKSEVEKQALTETAKGLAIAAKKVAPKLKPELYCGYLNASTAKNADAAVANAYTTVNRLCSGWMNASLSAKIMHCAKRANRNVTTERPSQPTSAAILAWLDTVFAAVPVPSERAPSTPVPLPDDDPPRVCCFTDNWKSGGKRDVPAEPSPIDPAGPDRVVVGLADGVVPARDDKGQVPPPSPSRRLRPSKCQIRVLVGVRRWVFFERRIVVRPVLVGRLKRLQRSAVEAGGGPSAS